jgi:hypothetical protein
MSPKGKFALSLVWALFIMSLGVIGFFSIYLEDAARCTRYCSLFYLFRPLLGKTGTALVSTLPWLLLAAWSLRTSIHEYSENQKLLQEEDSAAFKKMKQTEKTKVVSKVKKGSGSN